MANMSYFGIDSEEDHLWTLAQCIEGKTIVLHRFRNTVDGMNSMERFIRNQSSRPRIGIKLSNDSTLRLLEYLRGIPGLEVILVYEAGLNHHQMRLANPRQSQSSANTRRAALLAQCAARMI